MHRCVTKKDIWKYEYTFTALIEIQIKTPIEYDFTPI